MEPEVWRPVVGFESSYEVSSYGQVRSVTRTVSLGRGIVQTRGGRLMYPFMLKQKKKGYLRIGLSRDGRQKGYTVAHLVLEAFVGPRPPGTVGRHLDDDPKNNHFSNLAWGTHTENAADRRRNRNGYMDGSANPWAKLTESNVADIRRSLAAGERAAVVAARHGISKGTLYRIKKGAAWRHVP